MDTDVTKAGTALQTQQSQPLATLPPGLTTSLSNAEARLVPCGAKTGTAELAATLTLCAPTGMTQAERRDWINVARRELAGIPADLMERGCSHARKVADHPAKIIPAIFKEVGGEWDRRKRVRREIEREIETWRRSQEVAQLPPPEVCTPEDAQRIIAEVGLNLRIGE